MVAEVNPDADDDQGRRLHRVVSPWRPIPLTAQLDLEDYGLVSTDRPPIEGIEGVAFLEERPPEDLLDEHDLRLVADEWELWRGPDGRIVEVDDDRVVIDGVETDADPDGARTHVREEPFERIDVSGLSPR